MHTSITCNCIKIWLMVYNKHEKVNVWPYVTQVEFEVFHSDGYEESHLLGYNAV
jgi:hypothetical protein